MQVLELLGILCDTTTRMFSCGKAHAAYIYKLEENLTSLREKWDHLQKMKRDVRTRIEDAEGTGEMRRTNNVTDWLQKVENLREVIADIEGSQEIHNKCLSGCCPRNCVSSYKLGKKIVKKLSEVDELVTSGKSFLGKNVAHELPPNVVDEMPPVETVGLDSMLNKVWKSVEDENVGIIGLYGMGGAGKTTLLKRIHNEFGKRNHNFDVVLWVVVSRDYDVNKIMNDIRKRLGVKEKIWNDSNQDQRVAKIYQVLKQKKFVLMLDDLWENLDLAMVGVPLPKDNQSKVVFTTRLEDVCDKMQAQKKFKVECLSEREAFDLFCKKVGEETLKCHEEIKNLAWDMAKECKGLPLALVTVGSAMAGVKSVEAWRQAKSDLRSFPEIASDLKKVFCILKFSFDRLQNETHKSCFLYCALYPEDYEIKVVDLIDRWIGEGFLGKDKTKSKKSIYDMYEEGQYIIEKLKLSCLVEAVEDHPEECWSKIQMHDVIRDMALWLANDQDKNKDKVVVEAEALAMSAMDFEKLNVVERISIINASGSWQVPVCPNLVTLCVRGNVVVTDFSNLQCMTRLKVLDLSGYSGKMLDYGLLIEIAKLVNLEFLNLSGKVIRNRLPIEFKNLKKLRVFLMENGECDFEMIPLEVIEGLERLKVFRFLAMQSKHLEIEVALLEKLESLPELEELCIQLQTITGMHKLLESTKLRDCLRDIWLSDIKDSIEMPLLLESLSRMKLLDCISLYGLDNILDGLFACHLGNLRYVSVSDCKSITHLTWLRYAPLLEFLDVDDCGSIEEIVKGPEDEGSGSDIFSNLRCLELSGLGKLKSIYKRALAFPSLRLIIIYRCPNLRKLPLNSNSAKDSLIQIRGETEWWNSLEWEDTAVKDLFQSKYRKFW